MKKILLVATLLLSSNLFAETIYYSDGSFTQIQGNTAYNSDGSYATQQGNTTYFSDGTFANTY